MATDNLLPQEEKLQFIDIVKETGLKTGKIVELLDVSATYWWMVRKNPIILQVEQIIKLADILSFHTPITPTELFDSILLQIKNQAKENI